MLSPKQRSSIQRSNRRLNVWDGSVRSGKTIASIIAWLDYCRYGPPGPLAMIGKTTTTLSRNVLDVIDELHPDAIKYTRGAGTAIVMGRLVHLFGAHNSQAEGRIRGLTLAGAYLDEATLVSAEFFQQLLARMSVPGARLFTTTNPDSNRHWLMTKYLAREGELDLVRHHFTLDDNPSLDPAYLRALKAEFTGLFHKRFVQGLWVGADGAVYDEWDEGRHTISRDQLPPIERVLMVGVDYGQTHQTRGYMLGLATVHVNPDGALDWGSSPGAEAVPAWAQRGRDLRESRKVLIVLDEWAPGAGTVGQHAQSLIRWIGDRPASWPAPEWLAVDPAAKVLRTELFSMGHTTLAAKNEVLSGIQTVASLFSAGSMFVVRENCPNLLDRLPQYLWDEKATERGDTKPVKQDDDEVDALRYTVMTSRREWADQVPLHTPELSEPEAA